MIVAMSDEFMEEIRDLLESDAVQQLRTFTHHKNLTRLEHCLHVAYGSFYLAKRLGLDSRAAARGGLLHDLFLYDRKDLEPGAHHMTSHPKVALREAESRFELTDLEKDIIVKHMWPLSPALPKYRESFLVSFVDKYCACLEGVNVDKKRVRHLRLASLAV